MSVFHGGAHVEVFVNPGGELMPVNSNSMSWLVTVKHVVDDFKMKEVINIRRANGEVEERGATSRFTVCGDRQVQQIKIVFTDPLNQCDCTG